MIIKVHMAELAVRGLRLPVFPYLLHSSLFRRSSSSIAFSPALVLAQEIPKRFDKKFREI